MGCLIYRGLGIGFGNWAGVPLFWAMDPMRALIEGDVGWFEVGFGHGISHGRL